MGMDKRSGQQEGRGQDGLSFFPSLLSFQPNWGQVGVKSRLRLGVESGFRIKG